MSLCATITSWESFRTTAPTYFFKGNPFPIDLRVFGHSIHRLEGMKVITNPLRNGEFPEISLIFKHFHWFSLNFIDFPYISTELHLIICRPLLRQGRVIDAIECPNTRESIGNGFPITKYVGAVVWKSFQLGIAAEIDQYTKYYFISRLFKIYTINHNKYMHH